MKQLDRIERAVQTANKKLDVVILDLAHNIKAELGRNAPDYKTPSKRKTR
jgi:hypothetical protein